MACLLRRFSANQNAILNGSRPSFGFRNRKFNHFANMSFEESLAYSPETKVTTLPNGLRVASQKRKGEIATMGFYVKSGSAHEDDSNSGVNNFLEHMFFKGTKSRSQAALQSEVESMGAQIDAYTGREHSAFFMKALNKDVKRGVSILAEALTDSVYDQKSIDAARHVILAHMQKVDSVHSDVTIDMLHTTAFQGTGLARNPLGTVAGAKGMTRETMADYVAKSYTADRIALVVVGDVEHEELVDHATTSLRFTPGRTPFTAPAARYTGSDYRARDDDLGVCHVAIGFETGGWNDPTYYALLLGGKLVGSYDPTNAASKHLSSRLIQETIHDGTCIGFNNFHHCYENSGLWGTYIVGDRLTIDDNVHEVQYETVRICTSLTEIELDRAKSQLKAQLFLEMQDPMNVVDNIGRAVLNYRKIHDPVEVNMQINDVKASDVRNAMTEVLYDKCPVVASLGACEALQDYNRIRSAQYWLRL